MYTAEIQFRFAAKLDDESAADAINDLIVAFRRNGQVLSTEWPMAVDQDMVRTFVSIPERNALQRKRASEYVNRMIDQLKKAGLSRPSHTILGREPDSLDICRCAEPSAYILYTDFLSMESPLRCADCFDPVPLYRIPHTSELGTYEDLIFWSQDYQSCDDLQMRCRVGERFGTRQLSAFNSDLSRDGIECCRRVTEVTSKPCYYYLYRYHGRGKARETQRKCPSCNRSWCLKESWHGKFDFRCNHCSLLSNFAYSVH